MLISSTHPTPQTRPTAASAAAQTRRGLLWAGQQLCLLSSRSTDLYTYYQSKLKTHPFDPLPSTLVPSNTHSFFLSQAPVLHCGGWEKTALKSKPKGHQLEKAPVCPGPGCSPGPSFLPFSRACQHTCFSSHLAACLLHSRGPAGDWTGLQKPQTPSTVSRRLGKQ